MKSSISKRNLALTLVSCTALAACASPFAQRTVYDREVHNAAGTIAVSDAKLYAREDLIAERRADLKWIDTLIEKSTDAGEVTFGPSIFRETEQVTAFAAALGLNFDPAAGQNFTRNSELADANQEVDLLKLQLEIAKLENDLKLFKAAPPSEAQSNGGGSVTSNEVASPSSVSAADQLENAIKVLNDQIGKLFDTNNGLPQKISEYPLDHFDDFRDRSAYRDMLRTARNAAALDRLHDLDGNQLLRLNFQATVFPEPDYLPSLGIVQMRILTPSETNIDSFDDWVRSINVDSSLRSNEETPFQSEFRTDSRFGSAINTGFQERGVLGGIIAIPKMANFDLHLEFANTLSSLDLDDSWLQLQLKNYPTKEVRLEACTGAFTDPELQRALRPGMTKESLKRQLSRNNQLFQKLRLLDQEQWLESVLRKIGAPGVGPGKKAAFEKNLENLRKLRQSLFTMARLSGIEAQCADLLGQVDGKESTELNGYVQSLNLPKNEARVYEIGPKEQVQRISTVARSANSLALAASIAASDPSSGVGGSGAASFSRRAIGRAAGIERTPLVVGYAVSAKPSETDRKTAPIEQGNTTQQETNYGKTFGWVIGPSPAMDPKGKILLEQGLRTYDLTVDISVPAWWSDLKLEIETVWGPSPTAFTTGTLEGEARSTKRTLEIPIESSPSDEATFFSSILSGRDPRRIAVDSIFGGPLNECQPTTLFIKGQNLWRTTKIMVFDQILDLDNITLATDMNGLIVKVPKIANTLSKDRTATSDNLILFTPDESYPEKLSDHGIEYQTQTDTNKCAGATKPKDPDAVQVAIDNTTNALIHNAGKALTFGLKGKNLDKLPDVISVGHMRGKIGSKTSKTAVATFSAAALAGASKATPYDIHLTTKGGVQKVGKITFK